MSISLEDDLFWNLLSRWYDGTLQKAVTRAMDVVQRRADMASVEQLMFGTDDDPASTLLLLFAVFSSSSYWTAIDAEYETSTYLIIMAQEVAPLVCLSAVAAELDRKGVDGDEFLKLVGHEKLVDLRLPTPAPSKNT